MIKSGKGLILTAAIAIIVALAAPGCATKKYVSQQVNPVNQKLNQYQKETTGKIAWLTNKQQNDISQVNERIATTDQKVAEVSNAVQAAQGTASRAMEAADSNKVQIEANSTEITKVANSMNYQLVQTSEVLFAFNKANLTSQAKTELDSIVAKIQSMPRAVIELAGFTDPRGTDRFNLELSRRRAYAVQRYLVERNVPARSIHIVGFGKGPAPEGMGIIEQVSNPRTRSETYHLDRRVNIRVFGAGELTGTNSTQN
jgi:outer membrane protein OmpA-like peptidoglycan-associated protein